MPQLISHRDGFGWQTPNVTDMLDSAHRAEDQTGELRNTATLIIRKFGELGTPVRIKSLDAYPSHMRYHLLPDKVGSKGNERNITQSDIDAVLHQVLPDIKAEAAQLVKLNPDEPVITLFLRTKEHRPLSLRPLVENTVFIDTPNYTTFPAGVNLNYEPVLLDLQTCNHLLVVGSSAARLHIQLGIALTLMLFNSPSYVRIGLIGGDTTAFRHLVKSPHILGNVVTSIGGLRRLLDGLTKHINQRKTLLEKYNTESVDAFNKMALSNKELNPLPRIVLLLDTIAIPNWRTSQANWLLPLQSILNRGHEAGIHVVMTTPAIDPQTLPDRIKRAFTHQIVMRSTFGQDVKMPDSIPLEFIDGVLRHSGNMTPIELAAAHDAEIIRVVTYWQNMRTRRNAELEGQGKPATSGNTGLLTLRSDMMPPPPPITQEHAILRPSSQVSVDEDETPFIADQMILNARALAAYLGWLSTGPLVDVLNQTPEEAEETLRILRAIEVLEPGEGPVWRFARLSELPDRAE